MKYFSRLSLAIGTSICIHSTSMHTRLLSLPPSTAPSTAVVYYWPLGHYALILSCFFFILLRTRNGTRNRFYPTRANLGHNLDRQGFPYLSPAYYYLMAGHPDRVLGCLGSEDAGERLQRVISTVAKLGIRYIEVSSTFLWLAISLNVLIQDDRSGNSPC